MGRKYLWHLQVFFPSHPHVCLPNPSDFDNSSQASSSCSTSNTSKCCSHGFHYCSSSASLATNSAASTILLDASLAYWELRDYIVWAHTSQGSAAPTWWNVSHLFHIVSIQPRWNLLDPGQWLSNPCYNLLSPYTGHQSQYVGQHIPFQLLVTRLTMDWKKLVLVSPVQL